RPNRASRAATASACAWLGKQPPKQMFTPKKRRRRSVEPAQKWASRWVTKPSLPAGASSKRSATTSPGASAEKATFHGASSFGCIDAGRADGTVCAGNIVGAVAIATTVASNTMHVPFTHDEIIRRWRDVERPSQMLAVFIAPRQGLRDWRIV